MMNSSRRIALSFFLRNFYVLGDKINERLSVLNTDINNFCSKPLESEKELQKLNLKICRRTALNDVLALVEELKEEFEEVLEPVASEE